MMSGATARFRIASSAFAAIICLGFAVDALGGGPRSPGQTAVEIDAMRVGSKAAPLLVRVRAPRDADLHLRVNGHPVRNAFAFGAPLRVARLSKSDGLRPGTNDVRIRSQGFGHASRAVDLPGWVLRAEAAEDTATHSGQRVQLGPSGELGTPTGKLEHRWRVARAPGDADFALTRTHHPQPLFRADTPGSYVLRVSVRRRGEQRVSHDTVTVPASYPDPPLGAPINTIGEDGAIEVGGERFGAGAEIAYLLLERTTRQPVAGFSWHIFRTGDDLINLLNHVRPYGTGYNAQRYLMVVSSRGGLPQSAQPAFASLAKFLGAPVLERADYDALSAGAPFSIIGVPGAASGAATVRIPPRYDPPVSGAITGFLQKNQALEIDGAKLYDFASPDHNIFDSRAGGSSERSNVITFGSSRYEDALPENATAGFHVIVLESMTLRTLFSGVLATNGTGGDDAARQNHIYATLRENLSKPGGPLLIAQTVGKPNGNSDQWPKLVDVFEQRLGANRHFLNRLDGTNEYAIAGRVGSGQPPVEASTAFDGAYGDPHYPPAHLIGDFARARDSKFVPTIASTPTAANPAGGLNTDMIQLAWQPSTDWPMLAPAASREDRAAVTQYICEALGFCQSRDQAKVGCQDIRLCYWQQDAGWGNKQTLLTGLRAPDGASPARLKAFEDAKAQLLIEIAAVNNVGGYMERLAEPLDKSTVHTYVNLQTIGDDIWKGLQRPPTSEATARGLELASKAVSIAKAVPPANSAASGISAVLGLAAYFSKPDGSPILGSDVKARATELADEMFKSIGQANAQMTLVRQLFVSDYRKLMAASRNVDGAWNLEVGADAPTRRQLELAASQWFYEALVPVAYPYLIRSSDETNARGMGCGTFVGQGDAWPNQPDNAQMLAPATRGVPNSRRQMYFFTRGIGGAMSPPVRLGHDLFAPRPPQDSGLGIEKLEFFTPRVFGNRIFQANNNRPECDLGYLPKEW